jgi:UDP-2,3-diacylglucosamine hydrolase
VLPAPAYIVSDLHLGATPPEVERSFLAFGRMVGENRGSLVINGDLFDFWFEWRHVIPRGSFRVLALLADLVDSGVKVLWTGGNHDCWGGAMLRDDVGVQYEADGWEGDLAGWRARVQHGDGLRPIEDRNYRRISKVLRHPIPVAAMRFLHPDLGSRLATGSSEASRQHRAHDGGGGLRAVAMHELSLEGAPELIVYGHSHAATLERAPGGGVYANAGSWLDAPTFIVATPEKLELRRFGGSTESDRLHFVDR